jgi:Nif11 domain
MNESPLVQFVERLRADEDLKRKVAEAEKTAARNMQRDTDTMVKIAADAGYDISGWRSRPDLLPVPAEEEADSCCTLLTCCFVETSALVKVE